MLPALMFGARIPLFVGGAPGYARRGGDALIMRVWDVMLSFPRSSSRWSSPASAILFPKANDLLAFGVAIVATELPGRVPSSRRAPSSFSAGPVTDDLLGATLVLIALSIDVFADWLRDDLNPRLRRRSKADASFKETIVLSISNSWHRIAAVIAVAVLAACASTDYHFSQLYGKRYNRAPIDTYDVTIVRVDGKDTLLRPVLVDPGLRKVVVQGPPGGASRLGEQREIALDVRPCTRYYLVAVKPNRLASDFDIRVDYEEPVGGCTPPGRS